MTSQSLNLPTKRLIVFAGLWAHDTALNALRSCEVEAVMFSFMKAHDSKKEDTIVREALREWPVPVLKLLDSGVFTFLRATGTLRAKATDKKKGKAKKVVTREDFDAYAETYFAYLKEHLDDWDFVAELDVDNIFGPDVAREYRQKLRVIAGDKLMPVWHRVAGLPTWKEFYSEYPYIGTGSDKPMDMKWYRQLVNEAHAAGAKIHGFGGTRVDVMEQIPYDTADSTTWAASVRFGQFVSYIYRFLSDMTPMDVRRAKLGGFEQLVRDLGVDPAELQARGATQVKFEVAIRLLQKRQEMFPPIPVPRVLKSLF